MLDANLILITFQRVKDVTQVCVSQFNLEKFAGDVGVSAALGVSKNLVKRLKFILLTFISLLWIVSDIVQFLILPQFAYQTF